MKSQLPIIIALVILGALIISSLFYVTSVTLYVKTVNTGPVKNYWDIIDNELDTLSLVALKYASDLAYISFTNTFDQLYTEFGYTLYLVNRSAIYYSDFKEYPSYPLIPLSGIWFWDPNKEIIYGYNTDTFAMVYLDISIPSSTTNDVYLAFHGYADESINSFIIKFRGWRINYYALGNNFVDNRLEVLYYSGRYLYLLNTSSSPTNPYLYMLKYTYSTGLMKLMVYDVVEQKWYNVSYTEQLSGIYYGVGGRNYVEIHDLVLSVDRDPRFLYFENLGKEWKVIITNGTFTYEGIADQNGEAKVFFPILILRNCYIKVIDNNGKTVVTKYFNISVGGDLYSLESVATIADYDYYTALNNFKTALKEACKAALNTFKRNVLKIINNWIYYKLREGYHVNIKEFIPFYNITIWNDGYISKGRGSIGFNITYSIISPYGEFRQFHKYINATYYMEFNMGYPYGFVNMTLPIIIKAMITINDRTYYYMEPNKLLKIRINSILFKVLPSLNSTSGGNDYIDLVAERTLYLREGKMKAYYKLPYGSGSAIAAMDLYYDITNILVPQLGNHNFFLWAVTSKANIDGVNVPSALKMVFIYNYISQTNTLQVRIYGDENRPITPLS